MHIVDKLITPLISLAWDWVRIGFKWWSN